MPGLRLITAHLLESFMHRTFHTCSAEKTAAGRGQKMPAAIAVPPARKD